MEMSYLRDSVFWFTQDVTTSLAMRMFYRPTADPFVKISACRPRAGVGSSYVFQMLSTVLQ